MTDNLEKIKSWLLKYKASDCTIDIDHDGKYWISSKNNLNFNGLKIKLLVFPFKISFGSFWIDNNPLISLKNCPLVVMGGFDCSKTKIKSFEFMPKEIGKTFSFDNEDLKFDPYGARFALYSTFGAFNSKDLALAEILNKYKNNMSNAHLAVSELMDLGEKRGFTYD